jgi:Undecaprenyl-phosphate glucose phosphotransferase
MFRIRTYLTNTYLACLDLAITAFSYLLVLRVAIGADSWGLEHLLRGGFILILWLALSFYFRMYHSRRLDSPFADVIVLLKVALSSAVIIESTPRWLAVLSPMSYFVLQFAAVNFLILALARSGLRLAFRELRRRGHDVKQLVLVTFPDLGDRLEKKIEQRAHYGYRIVRHFVFGGGGVGEATRLVEEVGSYLRSVRVDDVILGLPAHSNEVAAHLVAECESQGIHVRLVPDLFPLIQTDTQIYDLDGIPLVNVRLYPTEYFGYVVCKRAFDISVSLAVLIVLSPLFLLIALVVKITSAGPVFFAQERVGLNGKKFNMLKFRTMRQSPALDPDSHWTIPNDPNVTRVGRWLRRSNLDELPQFLNVLKGDMSIVGPRPERPFFLERFRREFPEYMARHYVKSGITGWAQVNGWRGDTAIDERVAHDLYYIRNWDLKLDIKILLLTVMRTFFQRSAY